MQAAKPPLPGLAPGQPALSSPPCLFPISTQPLAPYPKSPILCSSLHSLGSSTSFPARRTQLRGEEALLSCASLLLPCSSGAERLAPV